MMLFFGIIISLPYATLTPQGVLTMKRRKVNYKNLAIVLVPILLAVILIVFLISTILKGCAPKEEVQTDQTQETTEASTIVTIGENKDGTEKINLDNQCGQAITSFKIRTSDTGDFGENLLGDSRIKNKATAQWYAESNQKNYNIEIKLANYTSFILHDVPVSDFNGLVTIKYKDGVGYLEYKPKDSENTISTYQQELEAKDAESTDSQQSTAANESNTQNQENTGTDAQTIPDETADQIYNEGTSDDAAYYGDGTYSDAAAEYEDPGYDESYDYGYYPDYGDEAAY